MDFQSSDTETDLTSSNVDPDDFDASDCEIPCEDGREKPLQLVKIYRDSEENLVLQTSYDVLDTVLETCGDLPLTIIVTTGEVRTGKSLIANCLLEKLKDLEQGITRTKKNPRFLRGFQSKHGYKPVTKGIWIWSRSFIVEDQDGQVAVLLLDTEGIDDEFSKPDEITAILTLSLLFSSITLINTSGIISQEIFNWISSISNREQNNFQKLSFLVKDWTRTNLYPCGTSGGKRYLQNLLSQIPSKGNFLVTGNKNVECCLLPHIGEKPLAPPFSGKTSDMNTIFQTQLQKYLKNLVGPDKLESKKILGNDVTAKEFRFLFLEYVDFLQKSFKTRATMGPEIHFKQTSEIVARYKITTAVNEYKTVIEKSRQNASAGFLTEGAFENVSTLARRKAIKTFQSLDLPGEKEKAVKAQLDKNLQDTLEQQKAKNDARKKKKTQQSIQNAVQNYKEELNRKFPFTTQEDDVAPDLVFYQNDEIQLQFQNVKQSIEQKFFEEFSVTNPEEKYCLQAKLEDLFSPIRTQILTKNSENEEKATQYASNCSQEILARYENGLKSKIKQLPEMDIKTLDMFHEIEAEKAETAFNMLKLGTEEFQSTWRKNLQEQINRAHQQVRLELESVVAKALEAVAQETSNYQTVLAQNTENMSIAEITEFHKNTLPDILKNFCNPVAKESPKFNEIQQKLQVELESTFQNHTEKATVLIAKAQSQIDDLMAQALAKLNSEIQETLLPHEILNVDEFQNRLEEITETTLSWFDEQTQNTNTSSKTISKAKIQTLAGFESMKEKYLLENQNKIASITNLSAELIQDCTQSYDTQMNKRILKDIHSSEELLVEHEKVKASVIESFIKRCPTNNTSFVSEQISILEAHIMERLPEIQGVFEITQTAANIGFSMAFMEAKQIYQENMDQFFVNNTKGFFVEQDLINKDSALQKSIFEKLTKEKPLTQHVISRLEEELKKIYSKYQEKNDLNRISYCDDEPAIGIDLGTTYCCVAVYHLGSVKIIPNSTGSNITPSYVTIHSDGSTPVVGQIAKDRAYIKPESTIFDAKRIIGRRFDDKKLQEDIKFWPFCVEEIEGCAKINVNGRHYFPEEISSMILKRLKKDAEEFVGKKVEKAVITVPAYFTDGQRQATIDAGELAGLKVLAILNEPTAAAVAYRLSWFIPGTSKKVLVYDLGGGTFDVAILKMTEDKIEVLSVDGDSHLGGEDFDKDLMELCAKDFEAETGISLFANKDSSVKKKHDEARRCVKRLQLACENAKRTFTSSRTASVSMDEIVRGQDLNLDIMRSTFYDRNRTLFETTIEIVDRALHSAGITKDEIDDIVMVGGSTRILKLQEMLQEHFSGKALMKNLNPDEAVAVGAAVQAAILNSKPGAKIFDFGQIQEVTPMSLGIKIATDELDVLIPKNTKIPHTYTQQYRTHKSGQTGVTIRIYQGEEKMAENNTLLGTFKLEGIPPTTTEKETIDVTMKINLNGILEVVAVCKSNNVKSSITVSEENRGLTKEKKARLLAELPP